MSFNEIVQTIATHALPVLLAITLHEAAHGYVAKLFGDNTAWAMGRVTLNPMAHIDPIGTIVMPLVLYFATSGSFLFGYAKPVPVDFGRLRHPKRDMIWVALAGPLANLLQAVLWVVALYLLSGFDVEERFFLEMAQAGVLTNLVMFAFNLFPIPPMDGGRIVVGLLPWRLAVGFAQVERFGFFIVMGLVLLGVVNALWMHPIMNASMFSIQWLLQPLANVLQLTTL
ncbi:MAG: site-2 protease family protein [Betaproteobacteria bacterium]|nr:site-2 protease family protein [Betaproteobacteria bacterium]